MIELGGVGPDQFDQLAMTGSAVLNGLLELSVIDLGLMDTPQPGDLFEILRADGGIVGTFASINGVELSNQLGLAVTYGPDSVVAQAALLGDANLDGVVDLSDFNIWNAYKFTLATNWRTGDFNGDGLTDGSDFNVWNANKFTSAGQPAAVPEPASATMIILLLVALFRSRFA